MKNETNKDSNKIRQLQPPVHKNCRKWNQRWYTHELHTIDITRKVREELNEKYYGTKDPKNDVTIPEPIHITKVKRNRAT